MSSTAFNGDWQAWAAMAPELTEQERALRDRFVDEYLVDYSPLNAARRVGFSNAFAEEYAKRFMTEPYVRQRIKRLETSSQVDEEDLEEYNKKRIRAQLMREAHDQFSTGAARVAALGKLMSMYGMDAPTRIQQEIEHRGGVMRVPAIANLDDWERTAMAEQAKLTEAARSDIH
jgi:hypothetical protein